MTSPVPRTLGEIDELQKLADNFDRRCTRLKYMVRLLNQQLAQIKKYKPDGSINKFLFIEKTLIYRGLIREYESIRSYYIDHQSMFLGLDLDCSVDDIEKSMTYLKKNYDNILHKFETIYADVSLESLIEQERNYTKTPERWFQSSKAYPKISSEIEIELRNSKIKRDVYFDDLRRKIVQSGRPYSISRNINRRSPEPIVIHLDDDEEEREENPEPIVHLDSSARELFPSHETSSEIHERSEHIPIFHSRPQYIPESEVSTFYPPPDLSSTTAHLEGLSFHFRHPPILSEYLGSGEEFDLRSEGQQQQQRHHHVLPSTSSSFTIPSQVTSPIQMIQPRSPQPHQLFAFPDDEFEITLRESRRLHSHQSRREGEEEEEEEEEISSSSSRRVLELYKSGQEILLRKINELIKFIEIHPLLTPENWNHIENNMSEVSGEAAMLDRLIRNNEKSMSPVDLHILITLHEETDRHMGELREHYSEAERIRSVSHLENEQLVGMTPLITPPPPHYDEEEEEVVVVPPRESETIQITYLSPSHFSSPRRSNVPLRPEISPERGRERRRNESRRRREIQRTRTIDERREINPRPSHTPVVFPAVPLPPTPLTIEDIDKTQRLCDEYDRRSTYLKLRISKLRRKIVLSFDSNPLLKTFSQILGEHENIEREYNELQYIYDDLERLFLKFTWENLLRSMKEDLSSDMNIFQEKYQMFYEKFIFKDHGETLRKINEYSEVHPPIILVNPPRIDMIEQNIRNRKEKRDYLFKRKRDSLLFGLSS